jgi:hypothetical protein
MSGTAVGYHTSRQARKDAQARDRRMSRDEQRRQDQIDANIRRLRSSYGIGEDLGELQKKRAVAIERIANPPEPSGKPVIGDENWDNPTASEAKQSMTKLRNLNRKTFDAVEADTNKRELEGYLDDYQDAVTDINIQDTQDQYGDAKLLQRRQLAKQGLLGGSVDYQARRTQLEQYVAGRQGALAAGRQARQGYQSNLTRERQNLEGQIQSGTQVNPNFREIEGDIRSGLDSARSGIGPTVAGELFSVAGNTIAQDQLNRGRRRPPGGTSTAPASGTITGAM